jgi:hypothetical protein
MEISILGSKKTFKLLNVYYIVSHLVNKSELQLTISAFPIRFFQKRNLTQSTKCSSQSLALTASTSQANILGRIRQMGKIDRQTEKKLTKEYEQQGHLLRVYTF